MRKFNKHYNTGYYEFITNSKAKRITAQTTLTNTFVSMLLINNLKLLVNIVLLQSAYLKCQIHITKYILN